MVTPIFSSNSLQEKRKRSYFPKCWAIPLMPCNVWDLEQGFSCVSQSVQGFNRRPMGSVSSVAFQTLGSHKPCCFQDPTPTVSKRGPCTGQECNHCTWFVSEEDGYWNSTWFKSCALLSLFEEATGRFWRMLALQQRAAMRNRPWLGGGVERR